MKLFVWDFHGTLEQGNEQAAIELSNMALKQLGYSERFSDEHTHALYGLKWYQYFEHLLPNEPHSRHLELQRISHDLGAERLDIIKKHIRPANHALEVLQRIQQAGHHQVLISNSSPVALRYFIDAIGLNDYFSPKTAFAVDNHLAETPTTKEELLRSHVSKHPYDHIVIIGDSPKDMELKDVAGGTTYLYAHEDYPFRGDSGDYHITDLRKILQEL